MDVSDVAKLCESLTLRDKEGPLMPLRAMLKDDGEKRLALRLVDVEIEVVGGNVFSFTFRCVEDRCQVLLGRPWRFDKALLTLAKPRGRGDINEMSFNRVAFWVQIHNVPLLYMAKEIGVFLGNMVGEFREIDVGPSRECVGKFIRVRVVVNVDEPLHRILCLDVLGDGKETTLLLRECLVEAEGDSPKDFNLLFGPWMKVASLVKRNDFNQLEIGGKEMRGPVSGTIGATRQAVSTVIGSLPTIVGVKGLLDCSVTGAVSVMGLGNQVGVSVEAVGGVENTLDQTKGVSGMDLDYGLGNSFMGKVYPNGPSSSIVEQIGAGMSVGPKVGKWKRWARDGVKINNGVRSETSLGKRSLVDIDVLTEKKLKLNMTNECGG
ncbi:hypothetical protein EZV62_008454 [Acer yangbiense]|uniref:Uncharacterized protein n=1 Tax=Acer yangbiense TaxID=1000413 RepID=A0A5C7IE12_9ROSI|nr:hypothetical protein EZV62_008454 [Acer yangbiense]